MRLALPGMMVGLLLAACADQRPQPVALVQPQPRYANCADDPCGQSRLATPATADITGAIAPAGVPIMDVEQLCQGLAQQGGATFHDPEIARALHDPEIVHTKKDCLDSEQGVRNELAKAWASFDPSDRVHCISESRMGGESSYTELITCLEMAREVRKLHDETNAPQSARNGDPIANP